jgi:hypothetical protein
VTGNYYFHYYCACAVVVSLHAVCIPTLLSCIPSVIGKYLYKEDDKSLSVTTDYLLHGAQWTVEKHLGSEDEFIRSYSTGDQLLLVNGEDIVVVSQDQDRKVNCAGRDTKRAMLSYGSHYFCILLFVLSSTCSCLCVSD